ncbi:hypothetical protein LAV_00031 [Sphingobium phage Lacusarx]|uniref:Uncharacterized protein n=1 Tax=Sphingobium phage Lacusarx TaxID=1980139 RepID=A0A1W6DX12_9CAUD|nr:hypothetical protein FDH44_gp031 [Sphingobium phage Lacusarx]ARK07431.1 hypothetical protein LAV_00031 [Sphingobium phage Lacusarx]
MNHEITHLPKLMKYRVEVMARWPTKFDTLAGVITFLIDRAPLWFILEEWKDDGWQVIIDREASRSWRNRDLDPGVEDSKTFHLSDTSA